MGLLGTRWEAQYEGHHITVSRNELTRGFSLELDGQELARRTWSLIGLGELHGSAEIDGKHIEIHVALGVGEKLLGDGSCTIKVDGQALANVQHVR